MNNQTIQPDMKKSILLTFYLSVATMLGSTYGAQNETYNDGKDVKWWNALSAKELRV